MPDPKEIFGNIPGGRVLDVATGSGGFIQTLVESLQEYTEIIGIDTNERASAAFSKAFKDRSNIRFEEMDAMHLDYPEASFDTVCISNSLHHFEQPQAVLTGMMRVLRPGGYLIMSEMYRDGQTETQNTHVLLHHWWAAVDRINGVVHRETFQREELVGLVDHLGLKEMALYDLSDAETDPKNPEILAELTPVFERYLQRAEGHPGLQQRGEELRKRVAQIGFHSATTLVARGIKK